MQSNSSGANSGTATGSTVHVSRYTGRLVDKRLMLGASALMVCSVWTYAHFGGGVAPASKPLSVVAALGAPQVFVATPRSNRAHIHVRSGPGAAYRILETLPRGTSLRGIARVSDTNDAFWIVLVDRRGYVKESLVTPINSAQPK
jgi:hypothetical protein